MTGLKSEVVDGLRAALRGMLLQPGDTGYDGARQIWNAMIDRRPALIVRATGTADVCTAVAFARDHGLPPRTVGSRPGCPQPCRVCTTGPFPARTPVSRIRGYSP